MITPFSFSYMYGKESTYCAFVSDPDGNNIEAVHKEPSSPPT